MVAMDLLIIIGIVASCGRFPRRFLKIKDCDRVELLFVKGKHVMEYIV